LKRATEDQATAFLNNRVSDITAEVIPSYCFDAIKYYKSFMRQLNIYGFKRTSCGRRVLHTHSKFIRGLRSLCRFMKRTTIKRQARLQGKSQERPQQITHRFGETRVQLVIITMLAVVTILGSHQIHGAGQSAAQGLLRNPRTPKEDDTALSMAYLLAPFHSFRQVETIKKKLTKTVRVGSLI
jgi:hypothetical protein